MARTNHFARPMKLAANFSPADSDGYNTPLPHSSPTANPHVFDNHRARRPLGDLHEITREVLSEAREMARNDPVGARYVFGIDETMVDILANMGLAQVRKAAVSGVFCFQLRFTSEFAARLAAMEATEIDVFLNAIGDNGDGQDFGHEYD